jgi:hypothetical protein
MARRRILPPPLSAFVGQCKGEGRMKWKALGLALALLSGGAPLARACDGQTGAVIFQDNFADDSGGWDVETGDHPHDQIKPPDFEFTLTSDYFVDSSENMMFNATFADYCMDFALPAAPAPDNRASAGIILWATDYKNYLLAITRTNGTVELYKKTDGNYGKVFSVVNSPAFNASPGAVNSLRVVADADQKLTVYLNGNAVKAVRTPAPTGLLRFGMFVELTKAPPSDVVIRVKNFSVNAVASPSTPTPTPVVSPSSPTRGQQSGTH